MKTSIHILHLEDDPSDAALVQATLQAEGVTNTTTVVQTRQEFIAELEKGGVDLVLSDYSLPAFDGLSALAVSLERLPDVPMILVSGTMGEELAADSLKKGATDYVLKERLSRLVPAVKRAILEAEDRRERRRLEAQFIEAQKMEVVGHLASGVSHDFNNILAVIMGYNHLIGISLEEESPLLGYVEEIRHAVDRAIALTRQLLVFSRKQTVEPVVLDLDATVLELGQMLRRLIGENIEMTITPGANSAHINADSGYIGQLLMNMIVNARDAMHAGGSISIVTSITSRPEKGRSELATGDYVKLSVSDTGSGMTEEVKARLFEAFFTTKPSGKGTGLGLATCHTIVQQSGGLIEVSSTLGQGSTFDVYFPRVVDVSEPALVSAPGSPVARGTETVMIVEDEPAVRRVARRILESEGYEVLTASNGQEALEVARDHQGNQVSLVVTDIIMPVMGGVVMAEWLRTLNPNLKVLFNSGYTDDALAQSDTLPPGFAFLAKPYTHSDLTRKVRELLDASHVMDPPSSNVSAL